MTKKTKLAYFILAILFLGGLFFRLYRLDQNLPELYSDEVGHYYFQNYLADPSETISKKLLSLTFTATNIFGLNPIGVRFMSAIYGSLLILVGFYFSTSLNKSSDSKNYLRVGLIAAMLFAVLPWSIAVSRLGHTHVPIVALLGTLHLALYIRSKNIQQKILSFIPFVLGSYYYPTLILISPVALLVPAKELLFDNPKYRLQALISGTVFLAIVIGVLTFKYQIFNPSGRGLDLAIWRDVNVTAESNLYRGLARNSEPTIFSFYQDPEEIANKLFFNYPTSVLSIFTKNYLSFFSPDFLFLKGDMVLRHSTGMTGNFYLYLLPFMVYGAYLFASGSSRHKVLIFLWLLASPLPAAITKDGATYLLRVITMMPILTYFCSLGIVQSVELFKNSFVRVTHLVILSLIALYSSYYYFYGYFHVYPSLAAGSFEYGFKDLAEFQTQNPGKLLIIWDDKYPFAQFCFWQQLPIEICEVSKTENRINLGSSRVDLALPEVIFSLPKDDKDLQLIIESYSPKYLAVPQKYQDNFNYFSEKKKLVKHVLNPDLTVSFSLYEI